MAQQIIQNATEENKQLDLYDAVSILVARYLLAKNALPITLPYNYACHISSCSKKIMNV
ncbi:hypothetical protein ABLA30_09990 [Xenorhabdus nematophila]|nr:hypothetical protein [Xenorhabdus nematophila]